MINRTLQVTNIPLISIGAASERYIGTTIAAIPTPNYISKYFLIYRNQILTPTINLPTIRMAIDSDNPIIIAPKVKSISANMIVGFLPILSENGPPNMDPKAAPKVARETIV